MTARLTLPALFLATLPLAAERRDYPIQPVPFTAVRVADSYWSPRMKTNRETTVGYCFDKCEETGRIANFEVAGGLKKGGFQGIYFNDSDVFKVIEGAAYTMAIHPDPALDKFLDGLIAIERGPLVYCAEGADHDGKVLDLFLEDDGDLTPKPRPGLLGGITVLTGSAKRAHRAGDGPPAGRPARLTMIPYNAWCHRGANEMAVWLPRTVDKAELAPLPTAATGAKGSASHHWRADHIGAINDGIEPANSNDHDIPRFTWWDHNGTTEWVQLSFARLKVTGP